MTPWKMALKIHRSFQARERVLYGAVALIAVAIAVIVYYTVIPNVVLTVATHPIPIVGRIDEPATRAIVYRFDYCTGSGAPALVQRELRRVSSRPVTIALYASSLSLASGCHTVDVIEPIPSYVPPGEYQLFLTLHYRIAARTSPAVLSTERFAIR